LKIPYRAREAVAATPLLKSVCTQMVTCGTSYWVFSRQLRAFAVRTVKLATATKTNSNIMRLASNFSFLNTKNTGTWETEEKIGWYDKQQHVLTDAATCDVVLVFSAPVTAPTEDVVPACTLSSQRVALKWRWSRHVALASCSNRHHQQNTTFYAAPFVTRTFFSLLLLYCLLI